MYACQMFHKYVEKQVTLETVSGNNFIHAWVYEQAAIFVQVEKDSDCDIRN